MADSQFTAELEWLCRIRRESGNISRVLRGVRKHLLHTASKQEQGTIRVWETEELAQMYDDIDRVVSLLDNSLGRYLEGPVTGHKPVSTAVPEVTLGENGKPIDPLDTRPIRGPGRRHGYRHSNLPGYERK
jgi:hypothetical protein